MKRTVALLALLSFAVSPASAEDPGGQGQILSAFFGLDNAPRIRFRTIVACRGFKGGDGMPVIFSEEIDETTLDAEDFRITTASGTIGQVGCVTLRPADEAGEKRTVLVIGDYGSRDDQPVTVEIIGDVTSLDGGVNFKGAQADVIPLEAGPTMILSEREPRETWQLGSDGHCPRDGVKNVVRVTWTGGITKPGGAEIDEKERRLYRVTVRRPDGELAVVNPIAVADLNDNDNNHDLCLSVAGEPLSVFFPAGALTDPNEDLNPDSEVAVLAASS